MKDGHRAYNFVDCFVRTKCLPLLVGQWNFNVRLDIHANVCCRMLNKEELKVIIRSFSPVMLTDTSSYLLLAHALTTKLLQKSTLISPETGSKMQCPIGCSFAG